MQIENFLVIEEQLAKPIEEVIDKLSGALVPRLAQATADEDYLAAEDVLSRLKESTITPNNDYNTRIDHAATSALIFGASNAQPNDDMELNYFNRKETTPVIISTLRRQYKLMAGAQLENLQVAMMRTVTGIIEAKKQVLKADIIRSEAETLGQSLNAVGKRMSSMTASLHMSRMGAYGYLVQADIMGLERYRINSQLDSRRCPVCRELHGKSFPVQSAYQRLDEQLRLDDLEMLKTLAPWPSQTKEGIERLKSMSEGDLIANGFNHPPFHPRCRCVLIRVDGPVIEQGPLDIDLGDIDEFLRVARAAAAARAASNVGDNQRQLNQFDPEAVEIQAEYQALFTYLATLEESEIMMVQSIIDAALLGTMRPLFARSQIQEALRKLSKSSTM